MVVWHSGCGDGWWYDIVSVVMEVWHSGCGDEWRYGIVGVVMGGGMA